MICNRLNRKDHFLASFFDAFLSATTGFFPAAAGLTLRSFESYINDETYPLSKDHDLEALEVVEGGSAGPAGIDLAEMAIGPLLGEALLGDDLANCAGTGTPADGDGEAGELEAPDGEDLALDVLAVDKDAVVIDDVDDDCEVAFLGTVVDADDATDFDELSEWLGERLFTIGASDNKYYINNRYCEFKYGSGLVGVGAVGLEDGAVLLLTGPGDGLDDGEADLAAAEGQRLGSPDLGLLVEDGGPDHVHGVVVGSVVAAHLHVELADGAVERGVAELLVHVVLAGTRLVLEDHTVGLHEVGALLVHLG